MKNKIKLSVAAIAAAFAAPQAFADAPTAVAPVVITATRVEQSSFDVPGAIDVIGSAQIRDGQPGVNLSESLWRAPGTVVLNRQNYAQDQQISIRGFGARSTFGVRGVKLVQDGIPLSMPDGQGQASTFDLANASRIEVLRGPFSAAYGNAAGGVIQMFTQDGPKTPTVSASVAAGSYGSLNTGVKMGGQSGRVNYELDAEQFRIDGYRDHSAAERNSANARLKIALDGDATLTLLGNWMNQNKSEDALGLTRAQYDANPRQAGFDVKSGVGAVNYNTRKDIQHLQGGATFEKALSQSDSLSITTWTGKRHTLQFQSIPATNQQATLATALSRQSPGGVVDFDRDFSGVGGRWNHQREDWRIAAGVDYETMLDKRKGYQSFLGNPASPTATGVFGALRRNEDDKVQSVNSWAQGEWKFARDWSLTGGLRNTRVRFSVDDHYTDDGANGSGGVGFQDTSATGGLLFKLTPAVNLFANWGQGFETPTFNEMFYQSDPATGQPGDLPGVNFALKPARSKNMELGAKAFVTASTKLEATLFDIETINEIVVDQNAGGRASYKNAGRTNRHGVELSLDSDLGHGFAAFGAYTRMAAYYRDRFTSTVLGKSVVTAAGNTLPAVPVNSLHAEISWRHQPSGFSTALEVHHVGQMYADDQNTVFAPAYTTTSLRLGLTQQAAGWETKEFLRADNLTDCKYVGSVQVNQGNLQYFEPGPGRNWTLGASASYKF